MTDENAQSGNDEPRTAAEEVLDFDLRKVTWGYQEIFRSRLEDLYRQGLLGESNPAVTRQFAEVLAHSDKSTFDSVLKSFLDALGGRYRWLLRIPRLFERWCSLGLRLASVRHFLGMKFFDACGEGRLGTEPAEVEFVLDTISLLLERQADLVPAFIDGYPVLAAELDCDGIRAFVFEALEMARRNPETAAKYLAAKLETSRQTIRIKTTQARLERSKPQLERLARALTGEDIGIESLGALDSDDLLERGCSFVGCASSLYLPAAINDCDTRRANENIYKSLVLMACGALLCDSFIRIHGQAGNRTFTEWTSRRADGDAAAPALAAVAEIARVHCFCRRRFPGARPSLDRLLELTRAGLNPRRRANRLLAAALGLESPDSAVSIPDEDRELADKLVRCARASNSAEETVEAVIELCRSEQLREPVGIPDPVPLLPDLFFPLEYSSAPEDTPRADLKDPANAQPQPDLESQADDRDEDQGAETEAAGKGDDERDNEDSKIRQTALVGYFYPEWDVHSGDYYPDWCCVKENRIGRRSQAAALSPEVERYANQVRKIFERLRPEEMAEQTRLQEGDRIHLDHLMEHIAERGVTGDSEMRFYNKTLVNRRDIAVAILLDLSGSTAQEAEARSAPRASRAADASTSSTAAAGKTVLQIEKEAAFVLASGLHALGDTFGLFGFTGTSRENCQFYLFKDFNEEWNERRTRDLLSAFSGSSTRIGAALRHAGWKLESVEAKTRLLVLITDGKPCDQGYDPETRYAHHDVRKACEENQRKGLHTFCISTNENTPADMDLMFPGGRYIILDSLARLPTILSKLYLRLTH
ncbi:MAG: nitric oxide reductase activation protein NorD [Verrucomicrobiota bacterium]